jgi:hypothetical protein
MATDEDLNTTYVVLQKGSDPIGAKPYLALSEPRLVQKVLRVIARHLDPDRTPRPVRSLPNGAGEERKP